MAWSKKDIENLKLKHNYHDHAVKSNVLDQKYVINGKISHEKEMIKTVLWYFKREGLIKEFVEELEFSETRKFRFDWAIPDLKLAIEYEGIFSKKSRHTTIQGFTDDCEKYNLAQLLGWKVLRYTAKNYQDFSRDLKKILNN